LSSKFVFSDVGGWTSIDRGIYMGRERGDSVEGAEHLVVGSKEPFAALIYSVCMRRITIGREVRDS
jgi:hypothetical protein